MSKYSIYATKQDYQEMFDKLKKIEIEKGITLDWKKIKRVNMDHLTTIHGILSREKK